MMKTEALGFFLFTYSSSLLGVKVMRYEKIHCHAEGNTEPSAQAISKKYFCLNPTPRRGRDVVESIFFRLILRRVQGDGIRRVAEFFV